MLSSLVVAAATEIMLQAQSFTLKNTALKNELNLNEMNVQLQPKNQHISCVSQKKNIFLFPYCKVKRHNQHHDCIPKLDREYRSSHHVP